MVMNSSTRIPLFPSIRNVHFHDEVLPMEKVNIICYAPVRCRNTIISQIETAVTQCGGYVDDFNFFSDLAVSLRILGIRQPETLRPFYQRLRSQVKDLEMDAKTIEVLNSRSSSADRYSLFILIQVLFMDAKGDMRREVPAVNS